MDQKILTINGPHNGQPVFISGEPLANSRVAMVMLHGRGASAQDMLGLAEQFQHPNLAFLVPQAAGSAWYPNPFTRPTADNEPWLSSALEVVGACLGIAEIAGIPFERVILLGFSQGACLTLEYAARNGLRYAGVVGLSGGVIGSPDEPRQDHGDLRGTPVFLGCSDVDPFIPETRVRDTGRLFQQLGAEVTLRIYPGLEHRVNLDEVNFVNSLLAAALAADLPPLH